MWHFFCAFIVPVWLIYCNPFPLQIAWGGPLFFNKGQRSRPVYLLIHTIQPAYGSELQVYINAGEVRTVKRRRYERQRRYEQDTVRLETWMVARVTVRVATLYVNPSIWSILQSKRIGFLWRWISFAEAHYSVYLFPPALSTAPVPFPLRFYK